MAEVENIKQLLNKLAARHETELAEWQARCRALEALNSQEWQECAESLISMRKC